MDLQSINQKIKLNNTFCSSLICSVQVCNTMTVRQFCKGCTLTFLALKYDFYNNRYYSDQRQQQRLLSSSSEKFLKNTRSFSTSSTSLQWKATIKTPYFLKRIKIFRDLYNYQVMIDPSFNEADFLDGCKSVS